jgi:hypothetical protein
MAKPSDIYTTPAPLLRCSQTFISEGLGFSVGYFVLMYSPRDLAAFPPRGTDKPTSRERPLSWQMIWKAGITGNAACEGNSPNQDERKAASSGGEGWLLVELARVRVMSCRVVRLAVEPGGRCGRIGHIF